MSDFCRELDFHKEMRIYRGPTLGCHGAPERLNQQRASFRLLCTACILSRKKVKSGRMAAHFNAGRSRTLVVARESMRGLIHSNLASYNGKE